MMKKVTESQKTESSQSTGICVTITISQIISIYAKIFYFCNGSSYEIELLLMSVYFKIQYTTIASETGSGILLKKFRFECFSKKPFVRCL